MLHVVKKKLKFWQETHRSLFIEKLGFEHDFIDWNDCHIMSVYRCCNSSAVRMRSDV